ncbi:MAG: hypothetical protein ABIH28_00075 [archaeon]
MDPLSKKVIIIISIFAVLLIGFIIFYLSFISSKTISARLLVEKEKVFVNDKEVFGEQILSEKDKVFVSETGSATIILYESVVVILESGTTIIVEELAEKKSELFQESGGTWSQFTKLFGIESYSIKTSTSVASVRGTGFYLNDSLIFVGEGEVDYDVNDKSFVVEEEKAMEKFGELFRERDMTPEEKEKVKLNKLEVIKSLKKLRLLEIAKHQKTFDFLKKKYDFTDEDVSSYLEKVDKGEVSLEDLRDKSPIEIGAISKIIEITEKIKEINSSI